MDLGITIKKIRKQRNLTQGQAADLCGITPTYISQIENNLREPNLSTLKSISKGLGMPLPILFFLSMTEDDVLEKKREAFRLVSPSIQSLLHEFFSV